MVVSRTRFRQVGLGLLEMTIAVAISAMVMLALRDMVRLGLTSAKAVHATNELRYHASFALDRIAEQARTVPQRPLSTPAANTTGDVFAPTGCTGVACVMYCRNVANRQLIETVTSDSTCSGVGVIASRVSSFSATLPTMGPLDRHSVVITLGLDDLAGTTLTQTIQVRLGGGVK